ncbi:MAG: DUF1996 domain-containing protein, partial [Actinomycetota bacterium]|nr:DUF1996 domain-containing protein [Actinomycetota bacterium]
TGGGTGGGTGGDTDTDGMADANETCDMQWGPRANDGCPYAQSQDYDFDGILDSADPITGRENQNTGFGSNPRIKANCDVHAINRVDPIAFTPHLHNQIGNTTTTNQSTGQSLFEAGRGATSCDMPWLTSAGWFPVIENEPVKAVNIYYRAPGDERYVQNLPVGTELLTPDQSFRCNTGPGEEPFEATPGVVYNCNQDFGIRLDFPDCVDLRYVYDHTRNAAFSNNGRCPVSHPYRIPKVNQLTMYSNADGNVRNPMRVSMGTDQWGTWEDLHADYLAAVQPEFNQTTSFGPALIELCLRDGQGSPSGPARCGQRN